VISSDDLSDEERDRSLEDADLQEAFYWAVRRGEHQPTFEEWAKFRLERDLRKP